MSIQQSNLIAANYGYDTVVSVSQKALNNVIETFYMDAKNPNGSALFTPVTYYFVKDGSGNPQPIGLAGLQALLGQKIDPLAKLTPAQITTLSTSSFYFAFSFIIGNPAGVANINYIKLNPGTNSVLYYLLCKQLTVVFWDTDKNTWVDIKQSSLEEFNIYASINLKNVLDNSNLPANVQAAVNDLGDTDVNVQQLVFDLDSAVVAPTSTLTGVDSSSSVFKSLMQQFTNSYFATYTSQSGIVLNYSITQSNSSSLVPTSMNWFAGSFVDAKGNIVVSPTEDQQDLASLNYLFSANGDVLNPGKQVSWNWLDDNGTSHNPDLDTNADVNKYDGAIAIKRDAFGNYLKSRLDAYAQQNMFIPQVILGVTGYEDEFVLQFSQAVLPPSTLAPFNQSAVLMGDDDRLLLYFHEKTTGKVPGNYSPDTDYMNASCTFVLAVDINESPTGNPAVLQTLTLTQSLIFSIDAFITDQDYGAQPYSGQPVNKTYKDVFTLIADDQGNISFTNASSTVTDLSKNIDLPGIVASNVDEYVKSLTAANFTEVPITLPKQFVFPGGNAFTFKDAQFSKTSDLVCHISYLAES